MGFDEGRIVLDSPNGAYYPSQTVFGRLEFDQDNVKTFRGIYVKIKGFCKVHWTTNHTRKEGDRDVRYSVNHESYEEYIDVKIFLAGGKDGEHQLQPGHHVFPFQCHIPDNCPSTFEGEYGHIRYQIKAVVDRPFKFDQEKLATFRVVAPLDLNTIPSCKEPIQFDVTNTFCCWCMASGSAQTLIKLPVSGFCPGQVMPIEVSCTNNSNVEIDKIKFTLEKKLTYTASSELDTNYESSILTQMTKGNVPGNSTRNWLVDMDVPAMDVLNLTSCRFIDIEYLLQVIVEAEGCHDDSEEYHSVMIGSVPLIGFQDDIKNPMQDQMPQTVQNIQGVTSYPITSQPLPVTSSYPHPVNYPGTNPPYPGSPGYPGSNTTHPGNTPYPGSIPAVTPIPGPNPPFSGRTSPFPGHTPPYPGQTPPYPGQNLPYPVPTGQNPPYPVSPAMNPGNSPYPSNTPYSGGPPAVPYPAVSPNTSRTGTTLLKTGTLGFAVEGGDKYESTMPLLPPGAAVPYPLPPTNNPYSTASAPEPSTPDTENKKPMMTPATTDSSMPSNPPYNPEFN